MAFSQVDYVKNYVTRAAMLSPPVLHFVVLSLSAPS